jgi:apolipoprotein N-acyltransferase
MFSFIYRAPTLRAAAILGWLSGCGYFLVQSYWIFNTCLFAGVPWPIGLLALGALAVVMGLNWGAFGAGVALFKKRLPPSWYPWASGALWVGIAAATAHFTPRLAGDLLCYTQWRWPTMIQIGALLGPHALGFLIMAWGAAAADFMQASAPLGARRNLALVGGLLLVNGGYGAWVLAQRAEPLPDGSRIEILQPNIDQYAKWGPTHEAEIRAAFVELLGAPRTSVPDLVLWPESAVPGWINNPRQQAFVGELIKKTKAPMLVGALARIGTGRHNAALLLDKSGAEGTYLKRQLVPFGEFVPLRKFFEGWIGILAQMGDFTAGARDQPLLVTRLGPLAASICYEAVFPHLLRRDAARGARIFANLTNDGWYKDTAGPYQHFYTNMFRAIENRVTVIRAGNTGISGVIDPYGVVIERTRIGERTRLDVQLPKADPFPKGSPFSRSGDIFGFTCMLAVLWLLWRAR